jgi:hypothetical protein
MLRIEKGGRGEERGGNDYNGLSLSWGSGMGVEWMWMILVINILLSQLGICSLVLALYELSSTWY